MAKDLIPPPSPPGGPSPRPPRARAGSRRACGRAARTLPRAASRGAGGRRAPPQRAAAPLAPSPYRSPLRLRRRRAGRRRAGRRRAGRGPRAERVGGGPAGRLVLVAADRRRRARRREADRRARRRQVPARRRRTSSWRSSRAGWRSADRPLSVALRTASVGGDIKLIDGHGVMYTLFGLGKHGSIHGGEPSEERHLLLRREALELALYTFRYADDVDMVVTLLPPPPPKAGEQDTAGELPPVQALFFRPGDLQSELGVPLDTHGAGADAAARADRPRRARGQADRRADALQPVHGELPAGPGRQRLPGAGALTAPAPRSRPVRQLPPPARGAQHARLVVLALPALAHRPELPEVPAAAGARLPRPRAGQRRRWPSRARSS